jgi:uncharacterized membrane protein
MKSCSKCGSAVPDDASFCGICGSPVSSAGVPAGPPVPVPPPPAGQAAGGLTSNMAAALSYLGIFITGIIFLAIEPYKRDAFVRFHAFQSIFFSVAMIILGILWSNFVFVGTFSWGLLSILGIIWFFFRLAVFLFWLFLMYKAYNNERFMIPFIGEFAAKQAGKEA